MGNLFTSVFSGEGVTPYLHFFVYHMGYYVEKYGGLDRFANFAVESWHRRNKTVVRSATGGYGHLDRVNNIIMQQLTNAYRVEKASVMKLTERSKRKRTTKSSEKLWVDSERLLRGRIDPSSIFGIDVLTDVPPSTEEYQ